MDIHYVDKYHQCTFMVSSLDAYNKSFHKLVECCYSRAMFFSKRNNLEITAQCLSDRDESETDGSTWFNIQ